MLDGRNRMGLGLSLLGNALLATAVLWVLLSRREPPTVTTPSAAHNEVRQSAGVPAPDWDWSRVQSADSATYARNLRALGCPEDNVVDLIAGEITARYADRWRSEASVPLTYWQSAGVATATEQVRLRAVRTRLERERREAIEQALGAQAFGALKKYHLWSDADADALDFLPNEKRDRLAAIDARHAVAAAQDPAFLSDADMRAAAADQARERVEIAALLSPRELEDLDLRRSDTAVRLREELRGFDATEAEFRRLFRVRRAYETTLAANPDVRDANVLEVRIQAERRFAEEARAALGDARYADYQRVRDPDFQNALVISQYYSLPADTATRIYELKQGVDARANGITSNAALPEQRQRDLLGQIQNEAESALRSLLGAEVLAEYRRNNRWWRFDE